MAKQAVVPHMVKKINDEIFVSGILSGNETYKMCKIQLKFNKATAK